MIANGSIHSQYVSGATQEPPTSSDSSNWLGRSLRVLAGVTCLVSGAIAAVSAASGFYSLAVVFGLVSAVSVLVMLFCGSKNAVGALETSGQQHWQPTE
ncbi:hypothetical protein GV64_03055 [Endozoicomonas elysicola]|uniref:Uncharacterized protein n=1 Tax=Endozoicomonas elysicola TaxID=305900 RepID=A0A081K6T0_9GAMM|nr:hypothetical protein GV64_03055 [Endozoicomonas elysicola]